MRLTLVRLLVPLVGVVASLVPGCAVAAAGQGWGALDSSFGQGGRVVSELPPAFLAGSFTHLTEGPDGELIASLEQRTGSRVEGSPDRFAIQRRLADGSLDQSFGSGGAVEVPAPVTALAVDSGGGVLYGLEGSIHRLDRDGSVDSSFTGAIPYGRGASVERIAVTADEKIVVAGTFEFDDFKLSGGPYTRIVLARLLPDGSPDPSFNGGRAAAFPDQPQVRGEGEVRSLAVGADGSVLLCSEAGDRVGSVRRFRSDGSPDPGFGTGGVLVPPPQGELEAMVVDAAGRIVLAGSTREDVGPPTDYLFERYGPTGAPDKSFGVDGVTSVHFGDEVEAVELAAGPDGGIVLLGNSRGRRTGELGQTPVLIRLEAAGVPVAGFGRGGVLAVEPTRPALELNPEAASGQALAVSSEGRIVVAGTSGDAMLLARGYGGTSEPSFAAGRSSLLETGTHPSSTRALGLVAEPAGDLIVGISTNSYRRDPDPGLLDYAADGTPAGTVHEPLRFLPSEFGGPIFRDGRQKLIVLAGQHELARIYRSGRPDRSFGHGGLLTMPDGFYVDAVLVNRDHSLIAVGSLGAESLAAVRFDPRGRLDRHYGRDGVASIGSSVYGTRARAAVRVHGGKLVLAGNSGDHRHLTLARLLPDGELDPRFGKNGHVGLRVGPASEARLVARQGGDLLVAGLRRSLHGYHPRAFLVRFRADGSFDRSFGNHGLADASGMAKPLKILRSRGRIVLVGAPRSGGVLLRAFGGGGTVDRRFGTNGSARAETERQQPLFYPRTAARAPGGHVVVAGNIGSGAHEGDRVELLRFR